MRSVRVNRRPVPWSKGDDIGSEENSGSARRPAFVRANGWPGCGLHPHGAGAEGRGATARGSKEIEPVPSTPTSFDTVTVTSQTPGRPDGTISMSKPMLKQWSHVTRPLHSPV